MESSAPQVPMRATMRDVAARAGVSLKTVSRVMNAVSTVAPELAERVHAAAAELGYRPNATASVIARSDGRSRSIGLILEDIANPFSAAILRAVQDAAWARQILVVTGSADEDIHQEQRLARTLIDRRVDGLLVVPTGHDQSYLAAEQRRGVPVVFLDRRPNLIAADAVISDNREGAARAVRHLLRGGHRCVAYLGDRTSVATANERWQGYEEALREAGLGIHEQFVRHGLLDSDSASAAAHEMLRRDDAPTAVFASQNLVTVGVIQALSALGRQDQIALVGFDDLPLADVLQPGITTLAQDPSQIGQLGAELLLGRIEGDTSPPQLHVLPTELIERGSGELSRRDEDRVPR